MLWTLRDEVLVNSSDFYPMLEGDVSWLGPTTGFSVGAPGVEFLHDR